MDSCTRFSEYVDLAVENGMRAIASTEHGLPRSWVSKKLYCESKGVQFIHGVEIYLTESLSDKVRDNYHTVLLARNMDGVHELHRLVNLSMQPDHFYYNNRLTFEEFLGISDNIIKTSACLASPLCRLPLEHPLYLELARHYDFLEIQPHNHPDQIAYNRRLYTLSGEIGVPLIAGTDTHSSTPYKAECRSILMAAKGKSYGDEDAFDLTFKTRAQLEDRFHVQANADPAKAIPESAWMEAIDNTNRLPELCADFKLDTSIKYPILYGSHEADAEKFHEVVEQKLNDKLERGVIPREQEAAFRSSIREELRVFDKLGMGAFMLSMSELISWCKEQGMAIGTARGSVGGSRAAYVADIIDLNPETWHTVFSRFCNEDREEIGDIDIDCVESDRPAIFQHIIARFGQEKTARVASYGTVKAKGIVDEVCRAKMYAWNLANGRKRDDVSRDNPYHYDFADKVKAVIPPDFDEAMKSARKKGVKTEDIPAFREMLKQYPEIFHYFDGLWGVKVSQSVHPAGMVISPVNLIEEYGVFYKDGDNCLLLDMEEAHDTGLAKYDFLVLKTVQVIRDCCAMLGKPYPKTNEIDWDDPAVWQDMRRDLTAIFQFEGDYAAQCFKKFGTNSIADMSLVTACIRPSGASYRDQILARKPHHNPSRMIDELLKDNLGYLVYQEDTIKFLQQICGLSGSQADNIRRAIGRKQKDRLEKALPSIMDGYCNKSPQPREIAEQEAKEFLQIIEDSASYQFGYNHSIAYCLLGYLCGYYRYYHPLAFLTSFLNNAANDDDIRNGTEYARKIGIPITMPKWGISRGDYAYDAEKNVIAKGLSSVKYMSAQLADELYAVAHSGKFNSFTDVLYALCDTCINARQLDILIKLDFFSEFGNQRELLRLNGLFTDTFKRGNVKQISKSAIDGTKLEPIVKKYAVGVTKSGGEAKKYTVFDARAILVEIEDLIKAAGFPDLDELSKMNNFIEAMGYAGYSSGREEDRRKLYVTDVFPLKRKNNAVWGHKITTVSIGSGKAAQFTVGESLFKRQPVRKGEVIFCKSFENRGTYRGQPDFRLNAYDYVSRASPP